MSCNGIDAIIDQVALGLVIGFAGALVLIIATVVALYIAARRVRGRAVMTDPLVRGAVSAGDDVLARYRGAQQ